MPDPPNDHSDTKVHGMDHPSEASAPEGNHARPADGQADNSEQASDAPPGWRPPDPPPIPDRIRKATASGKRTTILPRVLRAHRGHKRKLLILLIGVAVIALGYRYIRPSDFDEQARTQWEQLNLDYQNWYQPLLNRITDADRVVIREMGMGDLLADLGQPLYDPRLIAGVSQSTSFRELADEPPASVKTAEAIARTESAAAGLDRVVRSFARWPVRQSLEEKRDVFDQHGWDFAASHLSHVLEDAPPHNESSIAKSLRRMHRNEQLAEMLLADHEAIQGISERLAATDDPVLQDYANQSGRLSHTYQPGTESDGEEAFKELANLIKTRRAYGDRLVSMIEQPNWQAMDMESFRQTGKAFDLLENPPEDHLEIYRAWLDEAGSFRRVADDWRPDWAATQRAELRKISRQVEALREVDHPSADLFQERHDQAAQQIAQLLEAPLVSGTRAELTAERSMIESAVSDLSRAATALLKADASERVLAELDAIDHVGPLELRSTAVDQAWQAHRDGLIRRARQSGEVQSAKQHGQNALAFLETLLDPQHERGLMAAPDFANVEHDEAMVGLFEALTKYAARQREVTYEQALADGLPLETPEWELHRNRYRGSIDELERFAAFAQDVERFLDGFYALDENHAEQGWVDLPGRAEAWHNAELLDHADIANPSEPLFKRLEAVQAISTLDSYDDLTRLAMEARDGAIAFAAWRRLGEVEWPMSAESLDREYSIQRRLGGLIESVSDDKRKAKLRGTLNESLPDRWDRLAQRAENESQLSPLLERLQALGIEPAELSTTSAFNARLYRLKQQVHNAQRFSDEQRVRELTSGFIRSTRPLEEQPEIAKLIDRLSALVRSDAPIREDVATAGPATCGWTLHSGESGAERVVFTRGDQTLKFIRIKPPNGPATYLGETEVSIADVRTLAAEDSGLGLLLKSALKGLDDGPMAWTLEGNDTLGVASDWFDADPGYPEKLEVLPPTEASPMHGLPVAAACYIAAKLGCSLPTQEQFAAALNRYPPDSRRPPNLRDKSWLTFYRAKNQAASPQQPTALNKIFIPADFQATKPADAVGFNDRHLWFAPVQNGAEPVKNLVGNVAEIVTRVPVNEGLLLDPTLGDIDTRKQAFEQAYANAFAIVGGSALSPPELRTDRPQPIDLLTQSDGWKDVGFRLAFEPNRQTPAQQIEQIIIKQPYLY
jgi:hypothetical protein